MEATVSRDLGSEFTLKCRISYVSQICSVEEATRGRGTTAVRLGGLPPREPRPGSRGLWGPVC